MTAPKEYSSRQARARLFNLSRTSFWRIIYRERVPFHLVGLRTFFFPVQAIEALREKCMVKTTEDLIRVHKHHLRRTA